MIDLTKKDFEIDVYCIYIYILLVPYSRLRLVGKMVSVGSEATAQPTKPVVFGRVSAAAGKSTVCRHRAHPRLMMAVPQRSQQLLTAIITVLSGFSNMPALTAAADIADHTHTHTAVLLAAAAVVLVVLHYILYTMVLLNRALTIIIMNGTCCMSMHRGPAELIMHLVYPSSIPCESQIFRAACSFLEFVLSFYCR